MTQHSNDRAHGVGAEDTALGPVTIFGFDYPDSALVELNQIDKNAPIQTQLFARRLTRALLNSTNSPVHCISAAPISQYPSFPKRCIKGISLAEIAQPEGVASVQGVSFLNLGVLKIVTRTLSAGILAARRAKAQRNGVVVVYSVHLPFMIVGSLLARFTASQYVAVWTDPPAVPLASETRFSANILRRVEYALATILMRQFDAVIAVTDALASDFAPGVPRLVIEAFADPQNDRPTPQYRSGGQTVFTYTGSLDRRHGIANLVSAVEAISDSVNLVVRFFGHGDFASELDRLSKRSSRIAYMGNVSAEDALLAQSASDFLINARSPRADFTKYSFPSKTLEYMRSGVPVISTVLPGIPRDYHDHLISLKDDDSSTLARALEEATRMSSSRRREIGSQGRSFAESRNLVLQAKRLRTFLRQHAK